MKSIAGKDFARLLEKQGTFERLARVHAGESMSAVVAEYQGIDPVAMAEVEALAIQTAVDEEE